MEIKLHANATTTPGIRAYIQSSTSSVRSLARELGISETTVRHWRSRKDTQDRSHTRHNLAQSTTLEEESLICALRLDVGLSLDDLTEVMQRCVNPDLSRSAIYRCLKRHDLSRRKPDPDKLVKPGQFEATAFGFVHVDLKHLTRLNKKPAYVFVAIERTTRFAHIEIVQDRRAITIAGCFERFLDSFGFPVHTVLTDNGSEFTDRFAVDKKGKPEGKPSGEHPFDQVCKARQIEHRLTRPFRPQTNGMVERFNRRLSDALRRKDKINRNSQKNSFYTHEERNTYL